MDDAEARLQALIDRFEPAIAEQARACRARMRARFPTAFELVYDNYAGLAVGYGTSDRGSGAVVSFVVYPRFIRLFFLRGVGLPDPDGRLEGEGSQVRSIKLSNAEVLDEPAILALFDAAEARTERVWPAAPSPVQIRSVTAKQIPRRPRPKTLPR